MKNSFLGLRLSAETIDHPKETAQKSGTKNLSAYVRRILERPPAVDPSLTNEIARALDLTIRTRQTIGSLTGNINQIAHYYNSVWGREAAETMKHFEWDRKSRAELLPAIKELIEQNWKLIKLCEKALW